MTDRRTDREIEQALTLWMDRVAPDRAPTRLLEETFAQTMGTGQLRAYPWHKVATRSPGRTAPRSGARIVLVVLVALAMVAVAVGFAVGGRWLTTPSVPSPTPSPSVAASTSLPAPITVTPEAATPVQGAIAMVATGSGIWIMAPGRLDRIDLTTNKVTASVKLGSTSDLYNGLAANAAGLWATDWDSSLLYRVNPTTRKVVATIATRPAKGVLATDAGVWVANTHEGTILRIDPATNKVAATISVGPAGNSGPNWLAAGLGSIWVGIPNNSTVVRIDTATNKVQATIPMPNSTPCGGLAISNEAVWITSCSAGTMMGRIDPTSNTAVSTVDLGGTGYNPTLINGAPWIAVDMGTPDSGRLVRVDPTTNSIDRVLVPGVTFGGGGDIVVAAGSVWVSDGYNNDVIRLPSTAFGA